MELELILRQLCAAVPRAIGVVLADDDGESIVTVRGSAELPRGAREEAARHIPRALLATTDVEQLALRLAGAEPSAVLRLIGPGRFTAYEVRHREVDVLVERVDDELYVVLFVLRPALRAQVRPVLLGTVRAVRAALA
jgi:hypothetical protein